MKFNLTCWAEYWCESFIPSDEEIFYINVTLIKSNKQCSSLFIAQIFEPRMCNSVSEADFMSAFLES